MVCTQQYIVHVNGVQFGILNSLPIMFANIKVLWEFPDHVFQDTVCILGHHYWIHHEKLTLILCMSFFLSLSHILMNFCSADKCVFCHSLAISYFYWPIYEWLISMYEYLHLFASKYSFLLQVSITQHIGMQKVTLKSGGHEIWVMINTF
jgi:hypothetical protein